MRSCPHEKRIFCRPSSGYKNCGTRLVNFVRFFSQTSWHTILKPLTRHMPHGFLWWDWQFADRIFRPHSIERHAAAEPTQCPHILVAWCDFCCVALLRCTIVCRMAQCGHTFIAFCSFMSAIASYSQIFSISSLFFCFNLNEKLRFLPLRSSLRSSFTTPPRPPYHLIYSFLLSFLQWSNENFSRFFSFYFCPNVQFFIVFLFTRL